MDPKITRKGKEKNQLKNKNDYKYNQKRVRQYENQTLKQQQQVKDKKDAAASK
jgi:hypothetical protein